MLHIRTHDFDLYNSIKADILGFSNWKLDVLNEHSCHFVANEEKGDLKAIFQYLSILDGMAVTLCSSIDHSKVSRWWLGSNREKEQWKVISDTSKILIANINDPS